jgi:hypothetical protein
MRISDDRYSRERRSLDLALDPAGPGKAHTVGNPCPIPYRVLGVRVPNSSVRIYLNAFDVDWFGGQAAIFVVVSHSRVFFFNLDHSVAPQQKHTHEVSFLDGKRIQLTGPDGQSVSGELVTVSDGAGGTKAVMLDGQRVSIGNVSFKPGTGTLYGINC